MKILFLDFDGVLNSEQSGVFFLRRHKKEGGKFPLWMAEDQLCPISCSNLQLLMDSCPDLNIVVSSSWRHFHDLPELRRILKTKCEIDESRVIDITPRGGAKFSQSERGYEIQRWLDENTKVEEGSPMMPKYQVDDFIIIDDNADMVHLRDTNFVQTDPDVGLTYTNVAAIVKRFGGNLNRMFDI